MKNTHDFRMWTLRCKANNWELMSRTSPWSNSNSSSRDLDCVANCWIYTSCHCIDPTSLSKAVTRAFIFVSFNFVRLWSTAIEYVSSVCSCWQWESTHHPAQQSKQRSYNGLNSGDTESGTEEGSILNVADHSYLNPLPPDDPIHGSLCLSSRTQETHPLLP